MTPARATRVAELLRAELAAIVRTQMRDPRVSMLSITDARVSRDLGSADIYVSSLSVLDAAAGDHVEDHAVDGRADLVAVLNRAAGFLQSAVARRHDLRKTPKLRFHYDDLIESGPRLEALIDEAVGGDSQGQAGQTGQIQESVATAADEHGS